MDGSIDFIISFLFAFDTIVSLKYKIVENITEGFWVSAKSPLAREKHFSPAKIKNQTFLILSGNDNEAAEKGAYRFFRQIGIMPRVIIVPNVDTATLMTEAGFGVSFSYSKSIGSYNPALKFSLQIHPRNSVKSRVLKEQTAY